MIQPEKKEITSSVAVCVHVDVCCDRLTVIQTAVEEGLVQRGDRVIFWQPDGGKVLLVRSVFRKARKEL